MTERRRVVNGSCLTDATLAQTTSVDKFRMQSTVYPSLLMRYMVQFELVMSHHMERPHVLDLGCGNGSAARLYASDVAQGIRRKPIHYLGVDLYEPMLEKAREETTTSRPSALARVEYVHADLTETPWKWVSEGWADVVWYTEAIEHVPPYLALFTLDEAYRVSADGAVMLLSTPAPLTDELVWPDSHDHEFTRREIGAMLQESGWVIEDVWGCGVNWSKARHMLSEDETASYELLRRRISPPMARAVMQALVPDVCDDLVWLCRKDG